MFLVEGFEWPSQEVSMDVGSQGVLSSSNGSLLAATYRLGARMQECKNVYVVGTRATGRQYNAFKTNGELANAK